MATGSRGLEEALRRIEEARRTGSIRLDLSLLDIGDDPMRSVAPRLKDVPRLTTLDLRWNNIGKSGARALAERLKDVPGLTTLDVEGNSLGESGARALAEHLKDVPELTTLGVGSNGTGASGAQALAEHLKDVPGLTTLDVGGNYIGELGARVLAEHLKAVSGLTTLNMGGNQIGDSGVRTLAGHLKDVPGLTTLDVGRNYIGELGARVLAEHLKDVPGLAALGVGSNKIGDSGARALAEHLKDVPGLTGLWLGGNDLSELYELLVTHPALERLDVSRNPRLGLPTEAKDERNPRVLWDLWTKTRQGTGGDIVREVKIQLLGNGSNGKTCVWNLLFGQEPPTKHDPTQSFEFAALPLHDVEPPTGERAPPAPAAGGMFNAWLFDYGGQPHLHGSHRFFLADQRNVWVIVLRSDQDAEQNRLAYWLGMVRHEQRRARRDREVFVNRRRDEERAHEEAVKQAEELAGVDEACPPVVILLESWSGAPGAGKLGPLDAKVLSKEYGLDVRVVRGFDSFKEERWEPGLERLKAEFRRAITDTPEVWRVRVPKSFLTLRAKVGEWAGDPKHTRIAVDSYWRTMLDECEVEEGFRELYLHILRDLGAVLYVGDRSRVIGDSASKLTTAVYNPAWVKDPVYRVLWGDAKSGRDGIITKQKMETFLEGAANPGQVQLSEASERVDVLALMEECGLVYRVKTAAGVDRWLVPELLEPATPKEREAWGDSDTTAECACEFLPDYTLLPLIGLWREQWLDGVAVRRDQFAFKFSEGRSVGRDGMGPSSLVEVLVQTDAASRTIRCSLRDGGKEQRLRAIGKVGDELEARLGLLANWRISHRPLEEILSAAAADPKLDAVLSHLREHAGQYGLPSVLPNDFVNQVRQIIEESKSLGGQRPAVYRALNVAILLPAVMYKLKGIALDRGRLSPEKKHVRAVRDALLMEAKVTRSYFDVFGGADAFDHKDVDSLRRAYLRAVGDRFREDAVDQ